MINDSSADDVRKALMQLGFDRLFVANRIIQLDDWQPKRRQKEIPVLADRCPRVTS